VQNILFINKTKTNKMKKQFFLPVLAMMSLLIISCNNDKADSGDKKMDGKENAMSNIERNKANVLKGYDAINAHDMKGFMALCSKDIVDHDAGVNGKTNKGIDSVSANLQNFLTAFPDLKITITQTIAEGDWVAVFNNGKGSWKGEIMGMKPTGKSFNVNDADLFKLDAQGMIVEHWPTQEFSVIAGQVGMEMPK